MDLFLHNASDDGAPPLAERLRPDSLESYMGQKHVIGEGKLLNILIEKDQIPSLILWGPPGVGKTTLAKIIAKTTKHDFVTLSATASGVADVRRVIQSAQEKSGMSGVRTLLFIDEIHRWNKAQQDALLPHVENGTITLIGATTENPSFEVNGALLSRCQVITLEALSPVDQKAIINRALITLEQPELLSDEAKEFLIETSYGDARYLLNQVEDLYVIFRGQKGISAERVQDKLLKRSLAYDKSGEHHYNVISAFIKSLRGSDPDAALYYLARMYEAGEDPLFIARRLIIFASEDVGNANPNAVQVAISCMQAYDFVGRAEGWIPLAQCVTYLACSPKSNASYMGYQNAAEDLKKYGPLEVPLHLRNAPTKFMKDQGYGKGYKYAHDHGGKVEQQHLPDALKDKRYYHPTDNGHEKKLKAWLLKKS